MAAGQGFADRCLTDAESREIVGAALTPEEYRDKRVLVLVPDHTRSAPIPFFFRLLCDHLRPMTKQLDFMVALGTHPPMTEGQIGALVDMPRPDRERAYPGVSIFNHHWDNPDHLADLGTIGADEIEQISRGLLREEVPVRLNKRVLDYDLVLVLGPTFPHEVVGFSGGNKYFFPGIASREIIDFTHWLGALMTNPVIIGNKHTPVRAVIDRAAAMIPVERRCLSMVVTHAGLQGLYYGTPEDAWSDAADLSDQVHIVYKERSYDRVLS